MNTERELSEKLSPLVKTPGSNTIEDILKEICLYTGWPYGEAWKYDTSGNYMRFVKAWYKDAGFRNYEKFSSLCKFAPGIGLIGKALSAREPLWMEAISEDPEFLRSDAAKMSGFISGFAIPLHINKNVFGLLAFFITKKKHADKITSRVAADSISGLSFDLQSAFY